MKKIAIFFFTIIIIVVWISYAYLNYKASYNNAKKGNMPFESYYNQEIYGTELTTIINKAIDNNDNNEVLKDKKGKGESRCLNGSENILIIKVIQLI